MILSVVVYKAEISGGGGLAGLCGRYPDGSGGGKEGLAEAWIFLQNTQCRFF